MIFSCRPDRGASWHLAQRPCPSRLPTGSPARPLDPFLPPWMFLPPGLPGGPPPPRRHAQVPPACQLARLSSRGMSLRVAGPLTAPTSSISPKSRWMHNWPLCLHARRTRSPWCIGASPLYRPGAAGLANGGVFTNRAKDRADAQRLVATRLLDRLHDPLGHISRLQRIHPRAR